MSDKATVWGTVTREELAQYAEDMSIAFLDNVQKAADSGAIPDDANWLEVYAIMQLTVENSIRLTARRNGVTQAKITKNLRAFI